MLGTNLWEISRIVAWGFAYWKLNYTNSKVEALNQPCRLTIVPQSWGIIHDGTDYGGDTWRFNGPSTLIASCPKKKKKEKRKDNIRSLRFHFHEKSTPFSVCPCRDQRVEKLVRIPRFVRLITWPRGSTILFMRL